MSRPKSILTPEEKIAKQKEYSKKYYQENRDKILSKRKNLTDEQKAEQAAYNREWRKKNESYNTKERTQERKQKQHDYYAEYYKKNIEAMRQRGIEYYKKRKLNDNI